MTKMDWSDAMPEPGSMILSAGFSARSMDMSGAVLVSGDLGIALSVIAPDAPMLGLLEVSPEFGVYALRIARDRALLCSDFPLAVEHGWHEAGFALSAADDLYLHFHLEGMRAELILKALMGELDPSLSAMTLAGESACLISRSGEGFGIRVPRAEAATLWAKISLLADAF